MFPIGSVVYKIPAGDVEIAVCPKDGQFTKVIEILRKEFGDPETEKPEFVKFQIVRYKQFPFSCVLPIKKENSDV